MVPRRRCEEGIHRHRTPPNLGVVKAKTIPRLFFQEDIFEDNPSEEAVNEYILWACVSAFIYEAFQPAGLELSIRLGALLVEDLGSPEEIEVSISIGSDDEEDSEISGPAS